MTASALAALAAFVHAAAGGAGVAQAQNSSSRHGVGGKPRRAGAKTKCAVAKRSRHVTGKHVEGRAGAKRKCVKRRAAASPRQGASSTGPSAGTAPTDPGAYTQGVPPTGVGVSPPTLQAPIPLLPPIAGEVPVGGSSSAPPAPPAAFRFFSSQSFWNEALPADAALDPQSAELVDFLDTEIARELRSSTGPWINTTSDSVPLYTVAADQPTTAVSLVHAAEPPLAASWEAVPLPSDAQAAAGSDKYLAVWQPASDRLWEFWRLTHGAGGWSASWGGSMQDVSANQGVFGATAWPGAQPWWGASATSLPLVGGLITLADLQQGHIDHALAMSLPTVRAGVYASPAQREDGHSGNRLSLPEGARLRLDPALDLNSLHLSPLTLMIAQAAQRYGIFVRDRSSNVALFAQDPTPTGANPYTGPEGYFQGRYPSELLASFPWNGLQVLNMELHEG